MELTSPIVDGIALTCVVLMLASCSANTDKQVKAIEDVHGFLIDWIPQNTTSRVWSDDRPSLEYKISGPEDSLYLPLGIWVDEGMNIYVIDYGDYKIKRYDSSGTYVGSFGNGLGRAPGQFLAIQDLKVIGDSVVAVVDERQSRTTFFNIQTGDVQVVSFDVQAKRIAITDTGRAFWHLGRNEHTFLTSEFYKDPHGTSIFKLSSQQELLNIMLQGNIDSSGEDVVFAFLSFPMIMKVDYSGSVLFSRYTIDFIGYDLPEIVSSSASSGVVRRRSGRLIQNYINEYNGKLYVGSSPDTSKETTAIDVYDSRNGDYLESYMIPVSAKIAYSDGMRIYAADGESIWVFSLGRSQPNRTGS